MHFLIKALTGKSHVKCKGWAGMGWLGFFSRFMASKALILDALSSVPTRRQTTSFLNRDKRTIVVVDSQQRVQKKISELATLNANPIVLFQPKSTNFQKAITDAYQFMEDMPLGVAMKDLGDPNLGDHLHNIINSGLLR